jgi:hypothetical protein
MVILGWLSLDLLGATAGRPVTEAPVPAAGLGPVRWDTFKAGTRDFFQRLDREFELMTVHQLRVTEDAHQLTQSELDWLEAVEDRGIEACYADAAAAYGRAVFKYEIGLSMAVRYEDGDERVDPVLAADFLREADADRAAFQQHQAAAEVACS